MNLTKFIILLACFIHHILIAVCEERLVYGTIDEHNTAYSIFFIPLNGTAKPSSNSTFHFTSDFRGIAYIRSLQCTRNATVLISVDNRSNSKLYQFSLNGLSSFSTTFQNRDIKIRHDWLTGNLYLVTVHKIAVAVPEENSTTKLITKVVVNSPSHITDLAFNPNSGLMYFSTQDKIMQANMDGSEMKELVSNDISHPIALAIDLLKEGEEKLCWMDVGKKTIEFIKLNGNGRGVSIIGEKFKPSYPFLRLYEDQLIYVDENYNYKSINKNNGTVKWKWRILGRNEGDPQNFAICDGMNQPIRRRNPCYEVKCSHLCVLSAGAINGFQCLCPKGKFLDLDGQTCIAYKEKIIYAVKDDHDKNLFKLFSLPLHGSEKPGENSTFLFFFALRTVSFPDIYSLQCTRKDTILISSEDQYGSNIFQFDLNGVQLFNATFWHKNAKIRHDWLTGNLYVASEKNIIVEAPEENSTNFISRVVVYSPSQINDLVLNPNWGLMYFSIESKIMQVNMDGSDVKELVSNISRPVALAIDLAEGDERLYWMDVGFGRRSVEFIKLNGGERKVIIQGEKFSLMINWFMLMEITISSINKDNGKVEWTWRTIRSDDEGSFKHFTICDEGNQPVRSNPCEGKCSYLCLLSAENSQGFKCFCPAGEFLEMDGLTCKDPSIEIEPETGENGENACDGEGAKCSHSCVLSAGGFQCSCPSGKFLDLDGFNCIESQIAIASQNVIKAIGLDVNDKSGFETMIIPGLKSIESFCYNPKNNALILYDSVLKSIFEYNLNSKETTVLVENQLGNVEDIGIDVVTQNLYWIDSQRQTLEVMSLEKKARKILRFDLEEIPTQLFLPLDPNGGIFTVGKGWIREYSQDGISSMLFSDAGNQPMGFSYEIESNRYLWIEGGRGSVLSFTRRSNKANVLNKFPLGPVKNGLIHQGSVYWIQKNVKELRYARIGSSNVSKVGIDSFGIGKLAILNRDVRQLNVYLSRHECSWRNPWKLNCSHICIPNGNEVDELRGDCACQYGFELGEDGLTCERQKCTEMPTQFGCNNGTCISGLFVCDGIKDCGGNEDDMEELCLKWKSGRKLNILKEESNTNWWMILLLVLGLIASVGGGFAVYRKIVRGNQLSGSFSVIFKSGDGDEEKHE